MLVQQICDDAFLIKAFAKELAPELIEQIGQISRQSPFRQMQTPRGFKIAVAMTNCGELGWVSDQHGYHYEKTDPLTQQPWPAMPKIFATLARDAAILAGFELQADACLINRYMPGLKMGLHRDIDEQDMTAPIVSVSLGIPAIFEFGGLRRRDVTHSFLLTHGDVVVWGGKARRNYHGIKTIKLAHHPLTGQIRYNLTFRKAR